MEIRDVRKAREALRMTQAELAKAGGVSQSMIARIERGIVDPSYSNAKRIFSALESAKHRSSFTAREIMTRKVIFIGSGETLARAASLMKKKGISQLPVTEGDKVVGVISEREIASVVGKNVSALSVHGTMSEAPPIVSASTDAAMLSRLLEYLPCVLVAKKGEIVGLVSRADMLKTIS